MSLRDRSIRRELDRMAGEILRRQCETDACLTLLARRELLRRNGGLLRALAAGLRRVS